MPKTAQRAAVGTPSDLAPFSRLLREAMRRWPDRIAFDDHGRDTYTYAGTLDAISRIAAVFDQDGIGRGQGVGVLSKNCAEAWMACTAVQGAGGYFCGLPWRSSVEDMVYIARDAELSALVVHPDFADQAMVIQAACPGLGVYTIGPCRIGVDLLDRMASADPARCSEIAVQGDDIALVWYTGGTTGHPKGAIHTQASLADVAMRMLFAYELPRECRFLAASPISQASWVFIAPTLINGGTVVLMDAFEADRFIDIVNAKQVNASNGVPTMIYLLAEAARRRNVRMPTLERFIYGGSPIMPSRLAEAQSALGNIFTQSYGQSESLGAGTVLFASEHDVERPDRLASCGRVMPGVEIALLDDDGHPVPTNEPGELCMRTRSAMRGYWKQPEMTEAVFARGWLHTGDIARVDEDGYFTIVDRKKDMIVSGGYNVYPAEIERVIADDPAVRLVAVIGVPDEKWGEAVTAVIVPHDGMTVDPCAVVAEVRRRKGGIQAPKSVEIVDDMPLTSHGKVDKKALRAVYWEGRTRNVH